jgi:outer membrane receptor protein involved in Fe transport
MGNNVTEANAALKPEKLYGAEVAVGQDGGPLVWSATGFVNQLRDPVANVTIGVGPKTFPIAGFVPAGGFLIQRQNVEAINATGVEADARYRLGGALLLRLAGDYTDATVDGGAADPQLTGKRPAETPRTTVTAGADWTVVRDVVFTADLRYEDMRYADDQNTLVLPPATTLDLRLDWAATKNFGVYVEADNVTNTALATDETANFIKSYDEPRVIRFGLRFRG